MKIASSILAIIDASTLKGATLTLPPTQLDPKVYREVAKVIEASGTGVNTVLVSFDVKRRPA